MNAEPPPRPLAVATLKPTRTAQEFRWKYLKGQQAHATRLHEPAPEAEASLQWQEASVPARAYGPTSRVCPFLTRVQRIEELPQRHGLAAAAWLSVMIV